MEMICDECGGKIERKKRQYKILGQNIGLYPMLECTTCHEVLIEGTVSEQIEKELKKRGLWGLRRKGMESFVSMFKKAAQ